MNYGTVSEKGIKGRKKLSCEKGGLDVQEHKRVK